MQNYTCNNRSSVCTYRILLNITSNTNCFTTTAYEITFCAYNQARIQTHAQFDPTTPHTRDISLPLSLPKRPYIAAFGVFDYYLPCLIKNILPLSITNAYIQDTAPMKNQNPRDGAYE